MFRKCEVSKGVNVTIFARYYRHRRPEVFRKKDILKNFPKFHGKTPGLWSISNKVAGLRNLRKFLKTPVLYRTSVNCIFLY